MRISRLRIENFRSVRHLDIDLGDTTVFIGPNNAGKTAILDAVRIVLTRRWGQRGTGFTDHDVHRPDQGGDARSLPPVTITLILEEPHARAWNAGFARRHYGGAAGRSQYSHPARHMQVES
jgi:putative ATP-dependent endonuclease of OLD family